MTRTIKRFYTSEEGAVTVDWVVLTALLVGLAVAAFAGTQGGVTSLTAAIQSFLAGITVGG